MCKDWKLIGDTGNIQGKYQDIINWSSDAAVEGYSDESGERYTCYEKVTYVDQLQHLTNTVDDIRFIKKPSEIRYDTDDVQSGRI